MGRRTAPVSSSKVAVSPKTRSLDVTTRGAIPSAAVATRASVPQASQQHNQHTGPSSFPFPPPLAPAQGDEPGFVVVDGELPVARTNTTGTAVGGNGGTFRRRHSASTTSSSDSTASTASTNSGSSGSGGLAAFNVTFADLIAVPCPGADAEGTWDRAAQRLRRKNTRGRQPDEVPERVGSAPAALQSGGTGGGSDIAFASRSLPHLLEGSVGSALPPSSWITSDVRAAESGVRVLLYKHRELGPDTTLDDLAEDLLDAVVRMIDHAAAVARGGVPPSGGDGEDQGGKEEDPPRAKQPRARPIFFVCHSIGGLVFKKMLVAASQRKEAHRIIWNTHGATFFGTPHRGSSYLSMANLAGSIQTLLHLSRPLPRSIYERLRLNDRELLLLHEQFTAIASELRLWTFYEMVDSQLSGPGRARSRARETKEGGGGAGLRQEVTFSAPLVSIKSSLLGVRQEQVFAIEGDHAECASFGPGNDETRDTYLIELAAAIRKAMDLTNLYEHHPLSLKTHVRMELIGFYEDPDAGEGARPADEERRGDIRLYRTDYKLSKFLEKGPERCLEERLSKHRAAEEEEEEEDEPAAAEGQSAAQTATAASPSGGKEPSQGDTTASSRPGAFPSSGRGTLAGTAASAARASSAPAVQQATSSTSTAVADPAHQDDLVGSTLHAASSSTTAELQTTASQGSAASQHPRRSPALDSGAGGRTVSGIMKEGSALRYLAGFSRPDPNRRKFMWMHLPFNNPTWVKSVFETISRTKNQSFAHVFNHQHWYSKHVTGRHSQIQPSYVHPSCAFVPSRKCGLTTSLSLST